MPLFFVFCKANLPANAVKEQFNAELNPIHERAHVKGSSGRFRRRCTTPPAGEVAGPCPLANESEMDQAVQYANGSTALLGPRDPQRRARS